jgi:hypothetical protein
LQFITDFLSHFKSIYGVDHKDQLQERGFFMITCKRVLEIATRLESAYQKRFRKFQSNDCADLDRWADCACGLISLQNQDDQYPLDPELFIAVITEVIMIRLLMSGEIELAINHYAKVVRIMIGRLRDEISEELKWLRQASKNGHASERLILSPSLQITPLSRFIHAHRMSRPDLADQIATQVIRQIEVCPLYWQASCNWLSTNKYSALAMITP